MMNADNIHNTAMAYALDPTPENMEEAVNAVREGLRALVNLFAQSGSGLFSIAYPYGVQIGRAVKRGIESQFPQGSPPQASGAAVYNNTTTTNTYNITQTGAAQSSNSLRATVTALQMAG